MARDDKTCVMCNKHYKFCESCPSKYNVTETWRNIFCSENCRGLYKIYDRIKSGQVTGKEATKEIKKFDISYLQNINEPMKSVFNVLVNSKTKTDEAENKVENKSDVITENIDNIQNKKRIRSKNRSKKNSEVSL